DERVEERAVGFAVTREADGVVLVVVPRVLRGVGDGEPNEALPRRSVQLSDCAVDDDLATEVLIRRLDDLSESALVQLLIAAEVGCRVLDRAGTVGRLAIRCRRRRGLRIRE